MTKHPIRLGDVVGYQDRQWQVAGRSNRSDGVYLLLVSDTETERARPDDCELVGQQLALTDEVQP